MNDASTSTSPGTVAAARAPMITRRSLLIAGLIALAIANAVKLLSLYGALPETPDKLFVDWRTALYSQQEKSQRSDVAVVIINDDTLRRYRYRSPIDRSVTAALIAALNDAGAKVIGLDVIFGRPTEDAKDDALIEAIRASRVPVVLGGIDRHPDRVEDREFEFQRAFHKRTGRPVGHLYFNYDHKGGLSIGDHVVRLMMPGRSWGESPFERSFAEELAAAAGRPVTLPKSKQIAWLLDPADGTQTFVTHYTPEHDPVAGPALADRVLPKSWRPTLKDKIVLVGGSFSDQDQHLTPLSVRSKAPIAGVLIHAHILAQLLDGRAIKVPPPIVEFVLLVLLALFGFFLGRRYGVRHTDLIVYGLTALMLLVIGMALFALGKIMLPSNTIASSWLFGIGAGSFYDKGLAWLGRRRAGAAT